MAFVLFGLVSFFGVRVCVCVAGAFVAQVWGMDSGKEERTLAGHTKWVCALAVSPNGKHIVSGSADNTIKVCGGTEREREHTHISQSTEKKRKRRDYSPPHFPHPKSGGLGRPFPTHIWAAIAFGTKVGRNGPKVGIIGTLILSHLKVL